MIYNWKKNLKERVVQEKFGRNGFSWEKFWGTVQRWSFFVVCATVLAAVVFMLMGRTDYVAQVALRVTLPATITCFISGWIKKSFESEAKALSLGEAAPNFFRRVDKVSEERKRLKISMQMVQCLLFGPVGTEEIAKVAWSEQERKSLLAACRSGRLSHPEQAEKYEEIERFLLSR